MENLFISVAAACVYALFSFFGKRLFWSLNFKISNPVISLSSFTVGYEKVRYLPRLALPYGDALALPTVLKRFCRKQRENLFFWPQSASDVRNVSIDNMIIIGGPKHNPAAKYLLQALHNNKLLPFQFARIATPGPEEEMKRFVRVAGRIPSQRTEYAISYGKEEHFDVGTIIYTANPYNIERRVLLICGMSAFSTLIASSVMSSLR